MAPLCRHSWRLAVRLRIACVSAAVWALVLLCAAGVPQAGWAQDGRPPFTSDPLEEIAREYRDALAADHAGDATPTATLLLQAGRAGDAGRWRTLRDNLERIAARNPDSAATWLRLARAWRASEPGSLRASAAAYRAYSLARSEAERLDALFILGDVVYELWSRLEREDPGGAIAWRDVSKLVYARIGQQVQDERAVAERLAAMNVTGLRIVEGLGGYSGLRDDQRVGDSPPPVCVTFTDPLDNDTETLRRFVTVTEAETRADVTPRARIEVNGKELCISRLDWGGNYEFTYLAGLPAASGDTLVAQERVTYQLPSATPSLGFQGGDYILPRGTERALTLAALNYVRADLELIRLTDHAILRAIASGDLNSPMQRRFLSERLYRTGETIWTGELSFDARLNEQVLVRVPAGELIQRWEDTARAGGGEPPEPIHGGTFSLDNSRPDNHGALDPAAYAMLVEDAATFPLSVFAEAEGKAEDDVYIYNAVEYQPPLQWIVHSDLGLTLIRSNRSVHVVVRHISDGSAAAGARVELLARGGRVLGWAIADDQGTASFEDRLTQGIGQNEFLAVAAYGPEDFGFVLADTPLLNLSELDTAGRIHSGLIDAFATTDRQIYRPGETVSALVLLRDEAGRNLETRPPLQLKILSDSGLVAGQATLRADSPDWQANGHRVDIALAPTAPIGPATLDVSIPGVDRKLSSFPLQIRHFKPDRARVGLSGDWQAEADGRSVRITGAAVGEYLYALSAEGGNGLSAPVRGKVAEAWIDIVEADSPEPGCYEEYGFGAADAAPTRLRRKLETVQRTDRNGRVAFDATLSNVPPAARPRAVVPSIYMLDDTGVMARLEDAAPIPLREARNWVGIRQRPGSNPALDGRLDFELVSIDGANAPVQTDLELRVVRERTVYAWTGGETGWDYQPSVQSTPVDSRLVFVAPPQDGPRCQTPTRVQFDPPSDGALRLGTYRAELLDAAGELVTSLRFQVGAEADPGRPAKPQLFPVTLSQDRLAAGEMLTLAATDLPFESGYVVFGLAHNGNFIRWFDATIDAGAAETRFEVPEDWNGRFVHVFAQALGTAPDEAAVGRALGLTSFRVDARDRELTVAVAAPGDIGSDDPSKVEITVANIADDLPAFAMLFAVDEGIHRITGYEAPDPYEFFHGPQGFDYTVQDVYGHFIKDLDPAQLGENGGDLFADFRGDGYTSRKLALQVIGPVPVEDGRAVVHLDPFDFTGQVRLDAFAWTADQAGTGQTKMRVFDSLELLVGAPAHVHAGDRLRVPVSLRNISQGGTDRFRIGAQVSGAALAGGARFLRESVTVAEGDSATIPVDIEVPETGTGEDLRLTVTVADETGLMTEQLTRTVTVDIRDAEVPQTRLLTLGLLGPRESATVTEALLRDHVGASARLDRAELRLHAVPAARMPRLDQVSQDLLADDKGTRDLQKLASLGVLNLALSIDADKQQDILALQTAEGGFMAAPSRSRLPVLAPGYSFSNVAPLLDPLWRSAVALDYLQLAEASGQEVPGAGLDAARGFLATHLRRYAEAAGKNPQELCRREVLFAALVLARVDGIDRRSFETIKETCETYALPHLEVALMSSFLLAYGDVEAGNSLLALHLEGMGGDTMAGESLKDLAMSVAVLAENRAAPDELANMVQTVSARAGAAPAELDTDSAAWISRAETGLAGVLGPPAPVRIGARPESLGASTTTENSIAWTSNALNMAEPLPAIELTNTGTEPVEVFALLRLPQSALMGAGSGEMLLRRRIFSAAGAELIDSESFALARNDVAVFLLEGMVPEGYAGGAVRIAVPMPAGFDIEVSQMQQDAARGILGMDFEPMGQPLFFEALPDRLLIVIDPDARGETGQGRQFRYAFAARAVAQGAFTVPSAFAELIDQPVVRGESGLLRISVSAEE